MEVGIREPVERVKQFSKELLSKFFKDKCQITAASLAFTTLFCVVPFLTITYTVFSLIPSFDGIAESFQSFILDFIVPGKEGQVQNYLQTFTQHAQTLSTLGAVFLLATVSLLLHETESTFNEIWGIENGRSGVRTLVTYWAIISLGPFMLGLGFLLSSYVTSMQFLPDVPEFGRLTRVALEVMPLVLSTIGFAFIYKAVPNTEVQFRHALVGAALVTLMLEMAKGLFTIFVELSPTYDFIYGTFAVFPLFLLWMYCCWLIILLGAEVVCHLERFYKPVEEVDYPALVEVMLILAALYRAYQAGNLVTRDKFVNETGYGFSEDHWNEYMSKLMRLGWVMRAEFGGYILSRNLERISLYELYRKLGQPIPKASSMPDSIKGIDQNWYEGLRTTIIELNRKQQDSLSASIGEVLQRQHRLPGKGRFFDR